jgi:hypothetical protein
MRLLAGNMPRRLDGHVVTKNWDDHPTIVDLFFSKSARIWIQNSHTLSRWRLTWKLQEATAKESPQISAAFIKQNKREKTTRSTRMPLPCIGMTSTSWPMVVFHLCLVMTNGFWTGKSPLN